MTLLSGVLGARNTIENPTVPLTSSTLLDFLGIERAASGKRVTEVSALGMSAVWRAVTVASNVPASLPFHPYRQVGDARQRVETGAAARLMANPHPDMTPFELWQTVYVHRKLWGNAYLWIGRDQLGRIAELWPIHPARVKVGRTSEQGTKVYQIDNGDREHTDATILHLPGMGYDGICGVSPIRAARQGLGLAMAAEEYGAKLFGSGSLATGILQTEQRLMPDQADALQRRWKEKRSGLDSAHSTIVLDSGAKFQQLSIPPEDAQFLESRRFQIAEVCRLMGLPPFLMFETEKSTSWGTGLEQQMLGWLQIDLLPDLTSVEQRVTRLLKPEPVYAHYNVEGLLRGDSAARAAFYTAMFNLGALSTNEIRAHEELAPVDGGDVRYRPLNMGELGTTDSQSANQPTPQEVPA